MRPDTDNRIDGTTYPEDRAPDGSEVLDSRLLRLRQSILTLFVSVSLSVMRVQPGDVLVVRSRAPLPWQWVRGINRAVRASGCHAAVFMPWDCRVHAEPQRLRSEDRGYAESKTMDSDKANQDRGVFVGVPEVKS